MERKEERDLLAALQTDWRSAEIQQSPSDDDDDQEEEELSFTHEEKEDLHLRVEEEEEHKVSDEVGFFLLLKYDLVNSVQTRKLITSLCC